MKNVTCTSKWVLTPEVFSIVVGPAVDQSFDFNCFHVVSFRITVVCTGNLYVLLKGITQKHEAVDNIK